MRVDRCKFQRNRGSRDVLPVSRPGVQAFVGSLLGQKAKQGVFITTSSFTREAIGYVDGLNDLRVALIDGGRGRARDLRDQAAGSGLLRRG